MAPLPNFYHRPKPGVCKLDRPAPCREGAPCGGRGKEARAAGEHGTGLSTTGEASRGGCHSRRGPAEGEAGEPLAGGWGAQHRHKRVHSWALVLWCLPLPPTACRMAPERVGMLLSPAVSSQVPGLGVLAGVAGLELCMGVQKSSDPTNGRVPGQKDPCDIVITSKWPRIKGRLTPQFSSLKCAPRRTSIMKGVWAKSPGHPDKGDPAAGTRSHCWPLALPCPLSQEPRGMVSGGQGKVEALKG